MSDDHHDHDAEAARVAVLTISSSRTLETDESGDALAAALEDAGHAVAARDLVDDDERAIRERVRALADDPDVDAVVTTGGTGLTEDDVTVEAVEALFDRTIPGFGEQFRARSVEEVGPHGTLSRATAGVVDDLAVFCLPGSEQAARFGATELVAPVLAHVVGLAGGGGTDSGSHGSAEGAPSHDSDGESASGDADEADAPDTDGEAADPPSAGADEADAPGADADEAHTPSTGAGEAAADGDEGDGASAALTHTDEAGSAQMVDVGDKPDAKRRAVARGEIRLRPETVAAIREDGIEKGDVLAIARVGAIQAAKHTWESIPLCHAIPITSVDVDAAVRDDGVELTVAVETVGTTGCEMEALQAVTTGLDVVWDATKAVEKDAAGQYPETAIENVRVLEKEKRELE